MKILKLHEPKDGFCTMECEFSEDEINFFVEYAVNDILKKQIKKMEQRICFDCSQVIDDETIKKYPDTEVCSECINNQLN